MVSVTNIIFEVLIFLSVYAQLFFFITFLENRKKIIIRSGKIKLDHYPSVTITVPCWNEEKTVYKTVCSLLDLNYPKDKLKIFLIDDGSTDGTLDILRKFDNSSLYPNVRVFHKKNGGKYTVLNFGLEHMDTEFFGALDADSYADPESLVRIMSSFDKNPDVMAVVPSVTVHNAKNIIQNAQKAEYDMGVYFKKMLDFIGAINVTPGPLTIFRKKVFDDLGPYRHGHNTEDMEIAYRMQKNHYKIRHCNDAYVFTNTPKTVRTLYKQRLRWIYGFINNTIDYRGVLFRKKYGNFSIFTLPLGALSIFSVSYLFGRIVYSTGDFLYSKFIVWRTVGFQLPHKLNFDPFFINTKATMFMMVLIYALVIFAMVFGKKMAERKWSFSLSMLYFFPVFSVIAPFWLLKAVYTTIVKRSPPAWR
ncbi:MAG TPA: glycosyltransferase [Candidatus Paceibacterota bacterium]|jgi:cellulose synthase/poly-beta-1,6-N-acetylglucosamine synthase-like glycosyltransferase|nr:glycosyltransferase [Candidatus Paceibacterota bacterium]